MAGDGGTTTSATDESERIATAAQLEFVIFCIENLAVRFHVTGTAMYDALNGPANILHGYIVPSYDVLHTQGMEYILNDISEVMADRGVTP